ncbi:MAG: hypothetical protein ABI614_10455 [Planctomycetota bacterium]
MLSAILAESAARESLLCSPELAYNLGRAFAFPKTGSYLIGAGDLHVAAITVIIELVQDNQFSLNETLEEEGCELLY